LEYISETNEIVIRKDDYLRLGPNGFYKYIGHVKTIHEVPTSNCLYEMDGLLYIRRVDLERLNRMKDIEKPAKEVNDSEADKLIHDLKEIAKKYGVSKERVRQITHNFSKLYRKAENLKSIRQL
jgi:hypothetical protein